MINEPNPDDTMSRYSPPPEPRPRWSPDAWRDAGTAAPGSSHPGWYDQQPTYAYPTQPVQRTEPVRRTAGAGPLIVVAAVLAAVLSSGGTYLALDATGALDHAAPAASVVNVPSNATGSTVDQRTVTVDEQSAITSAAAAVSPAIVTITTQLTTTGSGSSNPFDPFSNPNQGQQQVTGIGSGIIFDSNGWILTNHHVVGDAKTVSVQTNDKRTFSGKVYGTDTLTDLAIVKIDATGLTAAKLGDSGNLKPGQIAIAIGSPLGTFTNSVTAGIVSALGRDITVQDDTTGQPVALHNLIQTDAAINQGNSGGALIDSGGDVIGVNTATASTAQGIGFAIPINLAKPIIQQALGGKALSRPWIGIRYVALDPTVSKQYNVSIDYGAYITSRTLSDTTGTGNGTVGPSSGDAVVAGSPADKAGLKEGDVITALGGQRVDGLHTLDLLLASHSPGETVSLQVLRNGSTITVNVTLGTRPANLQ